MPLPANAGRELAFAGLTGALSLVSPANLPSRALLAYRVTCATLAGAYTYDALRKDPELADKPAVKVALAVGGAGAVYGSMGLWERWDSGLHRWLLARGVKRPRLVIAAGATATSLLGAVLDAMATQKDEDAGNSN